MTTPNVTPAQIFALVTVLGGQAVAFGLLTGTTEQAIVAGVTAAVGIAWKLADAIIRNGRSRSLTGVQAAAVTAGPAQGQTVAAAARSEAPSGTLVS